MKTTGLQLMNGSKFRIAATALTTALPKNANAAKAGLGTVGYALDNPNLFTPGALLVHFVTHYGVSTTQDKRYGSVAHGAGKVVENVPVVGGYAGTVVEGTVEASTPEIAASVAVAVYDLLVAHMSTTSEQ